MCRGLIVLGQISVVPGGSFQCFYSVILFLESFLRIALKTLFCYSVLIFFFSLGHLTHVCWTSLPIFHFIYFLWPIFSLSHLIFPMLFFNALYYFYLNLFFLGASYNSVFIFNDFFPSIFFPSSFNSHFTSWFLFFHCGLFIFLI